MSQLFPRLRKGSTPAPNDAQCDLVDYHEQKPGATEMAYGSCQTAAGRSSYEMLLEFAGTLKGKTVVDLACGNGPLLDLLTRRSASTIHAVDLCRADLAIAKSRCGTKNIKYLCEAAQQLSIATASVDTVFCHLAFMLFNPIEPVIAETGRILKPGGRFAAVVSGIEDLQPLFTQTVKTLKGLVAEHYPHLQNFGWGDQRTWSRAGIVSLFPTSLGFNPKIAIDNYRLVVLGSPLSLARRLVSFFYSTDLLGPTQREALLQKWCALFSREVDAQEMTTLLFPLTRFCVTKKK